MYSFTETIYDLQTHHDISQKKVLSKTFYDIDTQLNAKCWSVTYSSSTYAELYELYSILLWIPKNFYKKIYCIAHQNVYR